MADGTVFVLGDSGPDSILIEESTVSGLSVDLNGITEAFTNVTGVFIDTHDGDDVIEFETPEIQGWLKVSMGEGNDELCESDENNDFLFVLGDTTFDMGSETNQITVDGISIWGDLEILGDNGSDTIEFDFAFINGNTQIRTAAGDDFVHLSDCFFYDIDIATETGSDVISFPFGGRVIGRCQISTGGCAVGCYEPVDIVDTEFFGKTTIEGGHGSQDIVLLGADMKSSLTIKPGANGDWIDFTDCKFTGPTIQIEAGPGSDEVHFSHCDVNSALTAYLGSGADFLDFKACQLRRPRLSAYIHGGTGNDAAHADSATVFTGSVVRRNVESQSGF